MALVRGSSEIWNGSLGQSAKRANRSEAKVFLHRLAKLGECCQIPGQLFRIRNVQGYGTRGGRRR
jgi:hypothetical protein